MYHNSVFISVDDTFSSISRPEIPFWGHLGHLETARTLQGERFFFDPCPEKYTVKILRLLSLQLWFFWTGRFERTGGSRGKRDLTGTAFTKKRQGLEKCIMMVRSSPSRLPFPQILSLKFRPGATWATFKPPWPSKERGFFSTCAFFWEFLRFLGHLKDSNRRPLAPQGAPRGTQNHWEIAFSSKKCNPTNNMNVFSRCHRFEAFKFFMLHQFCSDFRSFVFDVFSMDFDMIFGLLFDVSCTSLEESAKFENMSFDM